MSVLPPFLIHFPLKRHDPRARYRPLTYISPPFLAQCAIPFSSRQLRMESLPPASVHPPRGVGFFLSEGRRTTSGIFASRNCSADIFSGNMNSFPVRIQPPCLSPLTCWRNRDVQLGIQISLPPPTEKGMLLLRKNKCFEQFCSLSLLDGGSFGRRRVPGAKAGRK